MNKSTKWIVGILAAIGIVIAGGVLAVVALLPATRVVGDIPEPTVDTEPPPTETPDSPPVTVVEPPPAADLSDGKWFGFVTVDGDNGPTVVTIDLAEILTGEQARKAAVDAGVIEEGEDLPNDFFIHNPDNGIELITLSDQAVIKVLSAMTAETYLTIDAITLASIFNGSYGGEPVYGMSPDQPAPMEIVVEDGVVTVIESVYLP